MATLVEARPVAARETGFFLAGAIVMALVLVGGFSMQLAMGRSTFAVPWSIHAHAVLFFGWTAFYVLQTALVHAGATTWHRQLGWLSVFFIPAMVVVGTYVTVAMVRKAGVPFFFQPLFFLMMNPLSVLVFAGLASAGIILRRQTQWHRRLLFCAMAGLTGPGFGRLLPMPFLIPWADWATFGAIMIFPVWGVLRDLKVHGRVHPAWWWGSGGIVAVQLGAVLLAASPAGTAIYEAVTRGSPGAAVSPHAYPAPPPM